MNKKNLVLRAFLIFSFRPILDLYVIAMSLRSSDCFCSGKKRQETDALGLQPTAAADVGRGGRHDDFLGLDRLLK